MALRVKRRCCSLGKQRNATKWCTCMQQLRAGAWVVFVMSQPDVIRRKLLQQATTYNSNDGRRCAVGDNRDDRAMYSCVDYARIFRCSRRKARLLMERAGVVKVGKTPMVTAANHERFMANGDFAVHWPKNVKHSKCLPQNGDHGSSADRPDADD